MSEEEQERVLARNKDLVSRSLLTALRAFVDPLIKKGDYAQALRISQLAARVAEWIGDRVGLGNALYDLGLIYNRQYRAAQARDCFQKSLTIFEEAGDKKGKTRALLRIGLTYASQGRFDRALEYYDKSMAISVETGDKSATALIFNYMGIAHGDLGGDELGLELLQKSRALSEELNDKETMDLVYNNIAVRYIEKGRYSEALEYLQKCLKLLEEMGNLADKRRQAITLLNIGLVYRHQSRNDQALAYYRNSLKIFEEIEDKLGIANITSNIGGTYRSQGRYVEALEWLQKGLQLKEELQSKGGVASSLNNIGDIYRIQGRYDQALESLLKSLRFGEEINDRRQICLTLNNIGKLYHDQGKYAEMLEVSRRSARLAEEINSPDELASAQYITGRAFRALGQPAEARRSFLASIATVESLRHQVAGGEQQRQSFLEGRLSPWQELITLLVSQKEYAEALSFAERSKARALLDTLQAGRASLRGSLSPQEQQAEEEQRSRLVSLNSQLTRELRRDKPDSSRVTESKSSIEKARLEFENLETGLYAAHPELKVNRGEASIIKAEELASLLPDATSALLEYVVTDEATYLFVVTKPQRLAATETTVFTIPIKQTDLAKRIESFRQRLAERNLGIRAPAHKLYDLLLKPAQALLGGKSNLVIVPDDRLWELPFQALLDERDRYLIERSAVSYAPSLTVLREMRAHSDKRRTEPSPSTLLALGNPLIGQGTVERARLTMRGEKLYPLPEAETEVRALGRLYGARRSKVYIGAEAREDRLKAEAGQARILHFATHGVLNNAAPLYSYLALAQGDKNEDGLLEAWELMQLDLKADLAVLSACETARGRTSAGEGVIGLTWALFVAGTPATVVSQWEVESASTRDLMLGFHRQLQAPRATGKLTKAESLRRAAIKLMKNPETNHPFYWAGFVLVGDGR
jgi:CHAT domain-containing protein/tetratricopeptide (TPR) repeat protein